jgi:serine/threonine protein kinase
MIFLKKKGGSRFKDIHTVKICKSSDLIGIQTIKNSNEGSNDFVHVIKSVLKEYNKPVIVKILDESSIFLQKELNAIRRLADYEYSVQMICDFSCMDNMSRWSQNHKGNIEFCSGNRDKLHFIVYEYIEDGDISDYLPNATQKEIACIFFQLSMAVIMLAYKYGLTHGDLHSGNILMRKTDKIRIKYTYNEDSFFVQTNGFIPIFIDYGMSKRMKPDPQNIMDDIFISIQNCIPYIKSDFRNVFQTFLNGQFSKNSGSPYNYIVDIKNFIRQLT